MNIVSHIEAGMTDQDWSELEEQRASEDAAMEADLIEEERGTLAEEARQTALAEIEANAGNPRAQMIAGMDSVFATISGDRRV